MESQLRAAIVKALESNEGTDSVVERVLDAIAPYLGEDHLPAIETVATEIPSGVVIETRKDHDACLLTDLKNLIEARAAIMDAIGNGADETIWKPGEYYLDAFKRWVEKVRQAMPTTTPPMKGL